MNVEELRNYCLSLPGAEENAPWTEPQYSMLVTFTVGGKWFCLADLNEQFIDVKCVPDQIPLLIEKYQGAFPAWHMNKKHWLGVKLQSDVPDAEIKQLLQQAYDLIVSSLPKSRRLKIL